MSLISRAARVGGSVCNVGLARDPVVRALASVAAPRTSAEFIALEKKYGAHNYKPMPVVLSRARGVFAWDVEGRQYYDFLSAYSSVNQGHTHPRLVRVLEQQSRVLTLTSRAFFNDQLGPYERFITETLGFDRVLPMNTGVEAGETALKLARRWAYDVKGVPQDRAVMLFAHGNFWGRTMAAVSTSDDPDSYRGYGPLLPGMRRIPYGSASALEAALREDPYIAGFMLEPIQGEAGVIVPPDGYLREVRDLCKRHNVLMIADEVQTGLARTGRMLACDHEDVKPDIVLLGKALSGGMMPVSAVLARDEVMLTIGPGQHGSTYGGNPLACAIAREALQIILDEKLAENAFVRGNQLRTALRQLAQDYPAVISAIRGKGLLNAIEVRPDAKTLAGKPLSAWDICMGLAAAQERFGASKNLLAKPTREHVIRLAPPLVITQEQLDECIAIMTRTISSLVRGT